VSVHWAGYDNYITICYTVGHKWFHLSCECTLCLAQIVPLWAVNVYHLGAKIFVISEYVLGCVQSYHDMSVHCWTQKVSQWLLSVQHTSAKHFTVGEYALSWIQLHHDMSVHWVRHK
jgi:hypothetical protein